MTPEQLAAIPAVAVGGSVAIALYLIGRFRQDDLRLWRDGLVCVGVVWIGALVIVMAGEPATFILALPAGLAVLGAYALLSNQELPLRRVIGTLALVGGLLGFLLGLARLILEK